MSTVNQLVRRPRGGYKKSKRRSALMGKPQRKGVCIAVKIVKPRKPNSAMRKVAKIRFRNGDVIYAYIPGEKHNLQEHGVALIRGGKVSDIPGMKYKLVRGKYDLSGVQSRKHGRSKYGVRKVK